MISTLFSKNSTIKLLLISCLAFSTTTLAAQTQLSSGVKIQAKIWADNWYALYQGEKLIKEDNVAFNTERSFNSDTFIVDAELPSTFSLIAKDYFENDTGLEYIGNYRQQLGDGGLRAEFFDVERELLLAVSNDSWRCKVIHKAPINKDCSNDDNPSQTCKSEIQSEPLAWRSEQFDDSTWSQARIYSAHEVRPHGGYQDIDWQDESKLIWSEDLERDNILLCRFTIDPTTNHP